MKKVDKSCLFLMNTITNITILMNTITNITDRQ